MNKRDNGIRFSQDDILGAEDNIDRIIFILGKYLDSEGNPRLSLARADGVTKDELRLAIEMYKRNKERFCIKTRAEGESILDVNREKFIDGLDDLVNEKNIVGIKLIVDALLKTPKIVDNLPERLVKYSDHDTLKFRTSIDNFATRIMDGCEKDNPDFGEISNYVQLLLDAWKMYEFVMRDLLLRIDSDTEVPEDSYGEHISVESMLEPVESYFSRMFNKGDKKIVFDFSSVKNLETNGNPNTLVNVIQNTIYNASRYALGEILVKVDVLEEGENSYIVINIYNDGGPVSTEINKDGDRKDRLKICNPGYSTDKSTGLGIANAEERLESMGCSYTISNNQKVGEKVYNGFKIKISLVK